MKKIFSLFLICGASALSACCGQFVQSSYTITPACPNCPMNNATNPNQTEPTSSFRNLFGGDRTTEINNNQAQQSGLFSNTPAGGMMAPQQENQTRGFFSNFREQQNRPNMQDVQLINRVRQALMNNHNIDARAIRVTSDNGTVTLIGLVRNDAAKEEAENTAKNVDGVSGIDNKLTTQPNTNSNQSYRY